MFQGGSRGFYNNEYYDNPTPGSRRGSKDDEPYDGREDPDMLEEWNHGTSNPTYPSRNRWELPSPVLKQEYLQSSYGGGNHFSYNNDSWPSSAEAPYMASLPARPNSLSAGRNAHYNWDRLEYTTFNDSRTGNTIAKVYPDRGGGPCSWHRGRTVGQVPVSDINYGGPMGGGGQTRPIPSVADVAYTLTEGKHPRTIILCGQCGKELAKPYNGSYQPLNEQRHTHTDLDGYSYTTFHDSRTKEEVVRMFSDGLGGPCSWHGGKTVYSVLEGPKDHGRASHKNSKRSPDGNDHGGKRPRYYNF